MRPKGLDTIILFFFSLLNTLLLYKLRLFTRSLSSFNKLYDIKYMKCIKLYIDNSPGLQCLILLGDKLKYHEVYLLFEQLEQVLV